MTTSPSPNRPNGRDERGRFAPGNRGGPGNPNAKKVAAIRGALLRAVTVSDTRAIVKALIERAKQGDVPAAREVLNRTLGQPLPADIEQRLADLEEIAEGGHSR